MRTLSLTVRFKDARPIASAIVATIVFGVAPLGAQPSPRHFERAAPEAFSPARPPEAARPAPARDDPEGFYWYRDPEIEEPPKLEPRPQATVAVPAPSASTPIAKRPEVLEMEALQKQLEELRTVAIMRPTPENLRAYMLLQGKVFARANTFADVWQQVLASTPELDTSAWLRPTNAAAQRVFDEREAQRFREEIKQYAQSHGLFFYFRSDCPYCHAFAPVLKRFASNTGLTVMAISLDGGTLPDFPNARRDNGSAAHVVQGGITTVPAVILMNPSTGERMPVGFGVMSDSELTERLALILRMSRPEARAAAAQNTNLLGGVTR